MTRVMIATGNVAKTPHRLAKIERNIYTIEELCYSLVQSAKFLDADIMDPELVRWIAQDLGLPDLASRLSTYLGKKRALSDFVACILNYTGYVTPDRQLATRQIVASGQGMEPYERRYARAVVYADGGQNYQALRELEELLQDLPSPERDLRTKVLVRMGDLYADLFRYRQAADCYKRAYEITKNADIYLKHLAAVRFSLSDSEYVSYISEHPESLQASMELEKRLSEANAAYDRSEEKRRVEQLVNYRETGQETSYEIALHQMIQKMKDDYRMAKEQEL